MGEHKKRDRIAKACANCRRKKTKCDGHMPCSHCAAQNLQCVYEQNKTRRPRTSSTENMSSRLSNLEAMVSALVGKLEPLAGQISVPKTAPLQAHKPRDSASDANLDSNADGSSSSESGSEAPESSTGAPSVPAGRAACPKLPHNSIFHEYNSLLDVAQDTHSNEVNCERKLAIASQYKGPQIGFSILLSEQSINYVKSKLAPEHHRLVIPMQTIPMYLYASKKAFHSIWSEPQIQTAESIAKLRTGCFPEEAFIDEILRLFHSLYFANFICSVDYVRSLFDKYYANKASSQPDPKVLSYSELMIMSLVMVMCVTAYVDIKNSASSSEQNYPKISQFSLTELVAFQESVFKNALFYYHRICTVSEGLATIQALILMAIHLETSWVISDLNFSLTSMAVRYAQDMGLHRLDSAGNLSPEEKENRARVWRACQHFDIEVCYRSGKPPSVNLLDVSLDNLLFQETPAATSPNFEQQTLCNEYDKLAYIRCYTYMKLFSAQIKYDSLSNIQEVVSTINADMVRLAESTNHVIRPRFFNDPNFDTLLELFTNSTKPAHTEMVIGFHLTFFNHIMTVNRVPWAVGSDTNDPSTHENSKFRRLSLDSARTILHLIRTLEHSSTSILSFNWLVTYPFSAITNLLSNCLNYPDDPEVLKDLSLLIDVSLNTFGKIGSRAEEETNRLFYIRVRMADILIKVIMRVVITIVDQTCGTNILTSNPTLLEHLQMVEKKYPRFYRPLKGSNNIQHYVSTHPGNHVSPSNSSSKSPYIDGINKVSPTNTSSMASMNSEVEQAPPFSPGLSALEAIDFLEFGDKLETSAYGNPFMDNEDYVSLPNFFFDNGL